jgi:hypothetical protein
MTRKLQVVSFGDMMREEDKRVDQLTLSQAVANLRSALKAVTAKEAKRIGVGRFDPTYHGCDPDWRDLHYAAWDLEHIAKRTASADMRTMSDNDPRLGA